MKRTRLTKGVRRLLQGRSKGLTLVEIVIAIALIAIIGVAFLGGLSNAMFSLHIADVRTTAESLARSEMEYIKSDPDYAEAPWEIPEHEPPGFDGYTVKSSAVPAGDPEGMDVGIQEITVTVAHYARGEILTLVGYKGKRL